MPTQFSRPSPALVVAFAALVVALGGTAFAAPIRHAVGSGSGATLKSNAGGITTHKVFYAPKRKSATPTRILHAGGLVLTATCGNGDLEVMATSTVNHAHLSSEMYNSAGADGLHHSDFGPSSVIHLESLGDGNPYGETSFTYTEANGTIVNGQLSFDSSDLNEAHPGDGDIFNHKAKCLVSGFAMSTTAR